MKRIALIALVLVFTGGIIFAGGGKDEGDGRQELRFTSWANTGEIAVLQRAVDAYNEMQDDVIVIFESTASDTYEQKLITALSGGDAWDCFYVGDSTIGKLIENGSILKLNDFMASDASYCKPEDFDAGIWGAAKTSEGDIYGISVDCNPLLLYYSPTMFAELGIKSPQEYYDEGNWTYDSFDETLDQLQAAGKTGFLFGGGSGQLYNWMGGVGDGGTVWQKDAAGNDVYEFDANAIKSLEYVTERINDGRFAYSGLLPDGQGEDASFMSGLAGYVTAGKWLTPSFTDAGIEHDYIPYPSEAGNIVPPNQIAAAYLAVNKDSELIEEAMKFATFYCSEEGQKVRLSSTDNKPGNAIPSINGIDDIILEVKVPEHVEYLFDVRATGWALGGDEFKDSLYPGLDAELKPIWEEIWVNDEDPMEILAKVEKAANDYIADKSK